MCQKKLEWTQKTKIFQYFLQEKEEVNLEFRAEENERVKFIFFKERSAVVRAMDDRG